MKLTCPDLTLLASHSKSESSCYIPVFIFYNKISSNKFPTMCADTLCYKHKVTIVGWSINNSVWFQFYLYQCPKSHLCDSWLTDTRNLRWDLSLLLDCLLFPVHRVNNALDGVRKFDGSCVYYYFALRFLWLFFLLSKTAYFVTIIHNLSLFALVSLSLVSSCSGVCGCCGALRPRYKRLVDNIFPEDPEVRCHVILLVSFVFLCLFVLFFLLSPQCISYNII